MSESKQRTMNNVTMRLWTYLLPIPIILFYVLSLTGCMSTSPGIPNIFLLRMHPQSTSGSIGDWNIRINYFSQEYRMFFDIRIVWRNSHESSPPKLHHDRYGSCSLIILFVGSPYDAIQDICLPSRWGRWSFFVGLILLVLLKRGLKAAKPVAASRLQFYKRSTINTLWLSTALALSSALATTETLGALQYWSTLTSAKLKLFGGVSLQVLQWLVFSFSALFAFGISTIFKSSEENVSSAGSDVEKATPRSGSGSGSGASSGGAPPIPALNF
ncbi:hypothetical protein BCR34DRAFT_669974 [Clohesyomyces aquaticus]|uniref:Uncharacterized protein n=1 Tax=Clohesyomyces aquaticus TaxID=1231657 RepID=A0A1Y1Y3Y2_9PLEO|nr:hypothetical protein BCR34DRAFT_669974 [Clohesyomyces aquaticus]